MRTVDCIVDARAQVGEGLIWSAAEQRLYWVDVRGGHIHRTDPSTGADEVFTLPLFPSCLGLRASGGLVVGTEQGLVAFDPATGTHTPLAHPEADRPENRFNDGACDRHGRFWAGTMRRAELGPAPEGSFYRLDPSLACTHFSSGFWTTNGLAFSPEGRTMYYSDSHPNSQTIWRFDYDPDTGAPSNGRVFATMQDMPTRPDGGCVDAEGCYWSAGVGGWQLVRFTPEGAVDRVIDVPVERPSKPAFGGSRLDVLFFTSISIGLTPGREAEQPQAGGLFAVDAGVTGVAEGTFAG